MPSATVTLTMDAPRSDFRWLMMSNVCKHCTHAACLDVCPTGALFRTEFGTVVVQDDICNGCGYCVPSCPFGVIDRDHVDGRAGKCTLCYDRLEDGLEPACAKACPTDSIQFGELTVLRRNAKKREADLHASRRRLLQAEDTEDDTKPDTEPNETETPSPPADGAEDWRPCSWSAAAWGWSIYETGACFGARKRRCTRSRCVAPPGR